MGVLDNGDPQVRPVDGAGHTIVRTGLADIGGPGDGS
jgi:hypothetical protein